MSLHNRDATTSAHIFTFHGLSGADEVSESNGSLSLPNMVEMTARCFVSGSDKVTTALLLVRFHLH